MAAYRGGHLAWTHASSDVVPRPNLSPGGHRGGIFMRYDDANGRGYMASDRHPLRRGIPNAGLPAARRRETTTYGDLMRDLETDRLTLARVLDEVSRPSHRDRGVLLTVLVRSPRPAGLPGPGFTGFRLARLMPSVCRPRLTAFSNRMRTHGEAGISRSNGENR
jgi:hypothetical protein